MSKADQLAAALDEFLTVSPEVEAAAVVSADGLPMASALPPHVEEDRLAAMSAALLTLGERAATGLGRGDLAQVFVEGETGYVILMAAGSDAVLVTVTTKAAKPGLVIFEMRIAAEKIQGVMSGLETPAPEAPEFQGQESGPPAAPDPFAAESQSVQGEDPQRDSVISSW